MTLELGVLLSVLYGETGVLRERVKKALSSKTAEVKMSHQKPLPPLQVETVSCVKGCCKQHSAASCDA